MRAIGGDQRPQVELAIHWSSRNKQKVTALVDTGAKLTLIRSNPQVSGPLSTIDGCRGEMVMVRKVPLTLRIGCSPPQECKLFIFPIPENIQGIDILQGLTLQTSTGEFHLWVRVIKPVPRGNAPGT